MAALAKAKSDEAKTLFWEGVLENALRNVGSNQITYEELDRLIGLAEEYNVNEKLIRNAKAKSDEAKAAAENAGGGKRRNTRRHKKKANQTHRKKHRRNSRKKHNTRRKR